MPALGLGLGLPFSGQSLNADGLSLDLQFATDKSLTARKGPTPTFTRASTATFIGSDGLIQSAAINAARFDHDPITLACKGLLIEESRTNLVFPSDTLTTQTRTVTAVAHTLSFYGTGTIVLSGAHVATVTGTGAYPTRTTLTFTPTAGSLILTVTGSVTQAQLEAGAFPTSYIPTVAASVVRSIDICSITGSAFTGMYNATEGTWIPSLFQGVPSLPFCPLIEPSGSGPIVNLFTNTVSLGINNIFSFNYPTALVQNVKSNIAFGYKSGDFAAAINGGAVATNADARMGGAINTVTFGRRNTAAINGHIASIKYFRKRLPNAKLQTLTT